MPTLDAAERFGLQAVADGMRDALEEGAHSVEAATRQHSSFKNGSRPRSTLTTSIVRDAARRAASQAGVFGIDDSGEQLTLKYINGSVVRRFRLKKAKVCANGSLELMVGRGSALLRTDVEGLWHEESWILGYTLTDGQMDQVLVAEIRGVTDRAVPTLILGDLIPVLSARPDVNSGFVSDSEDELPGFEDEDGRDEFGDGSNPF